MALNPHIYLTYSDSEKLPYVTAFIEINMPGIKASEIIYKKVNELIGPYFIMEYNKEDKSYRSVMDIILSGEIKPDSIAEMNNLANLLSLGNNIETERILLVYPGCNTSFVPLNFKTICLDKILRYEY